MALQGDATVIGCEFRRGRNLVQKMPAMKDQRSDFIGQIMHRTVSNERFLFSRRQLGQRVGCQVPIAQAPAPIWDRQRQGER
jgi:hypothetical protein